MSFDLTIPDKDRTETLVADGRWHPFRIAGTTTHAIPPCDGFIQIDLLGRKGTGEVIIWLRFQRYPQLDSTAWVDFTKPRRRGAFGLHHEEHMTFHPGELYGVDYRIERGAPTTKIIHRILKGGVCEARQ